MVIFHKLIQDVDTRWGSTHDMLKRILEQQQPICNLLVATKKKELDLSDREITVVESLVKILEPIKQITESFSGEVYVTVSGILPAIRYIEGMLEDEEDDIPEIRQVKTAMAQKMANYYTDENTRQFLLMACFLDGRYKRLSFIQGSGAAAVKGGVLDMAKRLATELIQEGGEHNLGADFSKNTDEGAEERIDTSSTPPRKKFRSAAALFHAALEKRMRMMLQPT